MTQRDLDVQVALTDQGGGIGTVVWKVDGVTIALTPPPPRAATGGTAPQRRVVTQRIPLISERSNTVEVIAKNGRDTVESRPVALTLTLTRTPPTPGQTLYGITVGINNYRDTDLRLVYARPDAEQIAATLASAGKPPLFQHVDIIPVLDEQATVAGIGDAFARVASRIQRDDVFVFYLAGHGVTFENRYYFLPYNVRYHNPESARHGAVTQQHLEDWLRSIPARKKLVLIDTCQAGSVINPLVAMRNIGNKMAIDTLTRALTLDSAIDKTAIARLTHNTGQATLVASTKLEFAIEGYKGHGAFTYAVLKAFEAADTDKRFGNGDGLTTVWELARYVAEKVPEITMEKFRFEQVPQFSLLGDFPIGVVLQRKP